MDYLKLNGKMVNYKTRSKDGTNKKTKEIAFSFTKSYIKETKTNKKKEEKIMPYHTGHGKKKKKGKKKMGSKKKKRK
jgi:hypothetical protein